MLIVFLKLDTSIIFFRYRIVPVVFGLADYSSIAPPHSFINALDFPNVNSLAKYLLYLSENTTAYNQYFE